jgi:hypothetical protein
MQTLTLFVSSPGDVRDERQVVGRVVERIQARYWNFVRIEPVLWEKEPLRATAHFNEELIRPSDCDLFVCILWSRLGSPLPSQFNRADGTRFDSGTEWELVEATEAFEQRQQAGEVKPKPDILVYRRMSEAVQADPQQVDKLQHFCQDFFFNDDGTIRRAFSPYQTVDEFAQLWEQHLEKMVLRQIELQRGLAEEAVRPLPVEGSPFKGLGAFDFHDASLFFGRNRAIAETLEQWKLNHEAGHSFLLIYGGSGYGKSSLMRAGLAPRLTAAGYLPQVGGWRRTLLIPSAGGGSAIDSLARALMEAVPEISQVKGGGDVLAVARWLSSAQDLPVFINTLIRALDQASDWLPFHLLLMIDQLEEVFTVGDVGDADREQFFNAVAALAMCGRVWIVATMRSEFFPRIPENRNFYALVKHQGGYILSPPELSELHQIIRYPALAAGLQFERDRESGRDLSEAIYQDAADAPDALPLLQFTLEELYQRREENILTWKAYRDLGGLSGAIARSAQLVYEKLDASTRDAAARQVFGELITLDDDKSRPATRRRADSGLLEKSHPHAPAFLRAFIEAKLFVTSSDGGHALVTLAHEALTTHWPVLREWILEHRDLLQGRSRLEAATRLWVEAGKSTKLLLAEGRLAEAQRVADSGVFQLSDDEKALLHLSTQRAKRKLRLLQTATTVFALLAIVAGALGIVAKKRQIQANQAELATRLSLAAADFDAGAVRAESGRPDEALPYLLAALQSDPQNLEAQALLLSTFRQTAWHWPLAEIFHPQPVTHLAFGKKADELFTGNDFGNRGSAFNTIARFDLTTAKLEAHLVPGDNELQMLSVSPEARYVLVQRGYKRADVTLLCDAQTLKIIRQLPTVASASCFAWSSDGKQVAFPQTIYGPPHRTNWCVMDCATGEMISESKPLGKDHGDPIAASLALGRLRAVHSDGKILEMVVSRKPPELWQLVASDLELSAAAFNETGSELLVRNISPLRREEASLSLYQVENYNSELKCERLYERGGNHWLNPQNMRHRHAWSYWNSPFWKELLAGDNTNEPLRFIGSDRTIDRPFSVSGSRLEWIEEEKNTNLAIAPFVADAAIKSMAFFHDRFAVGTASGKVTVGTVLPRASSQIALSEHRDDDEWEAWLTQKNLAQGATWTRRYGENVLKTAAGQEIPLEQHPDWQMMADCSLHPDGGIAVLAGYGSSTGGYVSPGLLMVDAKNGRVLSDLVALEAPRAVEFLPDGKRIAAIGSDEVAILQWSDGALRRIGSIPAAGAIAMHPFSLPEIGDCLALTTIERITIYRLSDFSAISNLPLPGTKAQYTELAEGGLEPRQSAWAIEAEKGWLAFRLDQVLHVWHIRSGRLLLANLPLPRGNDALAFTEQDRVIGLTIEGAKKSFIPLAHRDGISASQWSIVNDLMQGYSGVTFAGESRSILRLDPPARAKALQSAYKIAHQLPSVFQNFPSLPIKLETPLTTIDAAAWETLWRDLLLGPFPNYPEIARNTVQFHDRPWRQQMLRGLIAREDARLFSPAKEEEVLTDAENERAYYNVYDGIYHELAEEKPLRDLKTAAWKWKYTTPQTAGVALTEEWDEEWKNIDRAAVKRLEPAALKALSEALAEYPQNDVRKVILQWIEERGKYQALLETCLQERREAYFRAFDVNDGYAFAEALLMLGRRSEAVAWMQILACLPHPLSLGSAHFIIASGESYAHENPLRDAMQRLQSPWLWREWLAQEGPGTQTTSDAAAAILAADASANVATTYLLELAIARLNAETLTLIRQRAKGLPATLSRFIEAIEADMNGDPPRVFALWPDEFPDLLSRSEQEDWNGWAAGIDITAAGEIIQEWERKTEILRCEKNAPVEEVMKVANALLDPEKETLFGRARIARAIPACGEELGHWIGTDKALQALHAKALAMGLPATACQRIAAQERSSAQDYAAAASLWRQVLSDPDATAEDSLSGIQCLIESKQPAPAFRIALEGLQRFATTESYQNDSAWYFLNASLPQEALAILSQPFPLTSEKEQQRQRWYRIAAAEMAGESAQADALFRPLREQNPDLSFEEQISKMPLPDPIKQALLKVAKRHP